MYLVVALFVFILHIHTCTSRADVLCILDGNAEPLCKTMVRPVVQRNSSLHALPSYRKLIIPDYIPETLYFKNCTENRYRSQCKIISITSITQIGKPTDDIEVCYEKNLNKVECHRTHYHYYCDPDKVFILSKLIPDKRFYVADCLEYTSDKVLVCRPSVNERMRSHVFLIHAGKLVKRAQNYALRQRNFICEEENKYNDRKDDMYNVTINCDLNLYVPYKTGMHTRTGIKVYKSVIFRINNVSIELKYNCKGSWCGYSGSGRVKPATRRNNTYRCFYANGILCQLSEESYIAHDKPDWLTR